MQLKPNQLEEIIVQDKKEGKNLPKLESEYILGFPMKNLETPQSFSNINQEVLTEQNITDYPSAIQSIPGGVLSSINPVGVAGVFLRGFLTTTNIRNGIYNQTPTGGDPQVVERIELIRGPSAGVFGTAGVSYGGLVNKITKKPFNGKLFSTSLTLGSYNLQRFTVDLNMPIDREKKLYFRFNSAFHSEDSFQDFGFRKNYLFAPSFSYKLNDRLMLSLEAEINITDRSFQTYFLGAGKLDKKSIDQINLDYYKSYSANNFNTSPSFLFNYFGKINYEVSNNWQFNTDLALSNYELNGGNIVPSFLNDSLFVRRVYTYSAKYSTLSLRPTFRGTFSVFKLKNKFVGGLDLKWAEATPVESIDLSADTINYTNKIIPLLNEETVKSGYDIQLFDNESVYVYAAFFSDIIDISERFNLFLSLRYESYNYKGKIDKITGISKTTPYEQNAVTPQAGLTYQIIKNRISLFADYMQGYNNVPPNIYGQSFKPEFAVQLEGGIKLNLFKNALSSTLSYYNILVKNKVRFDPENAPLSKQDAAQQSKGIDVDLRFHPTDEFSIIAGYSFNKSKFTKADSSIEGNHPPATPKNSVNFWASYTISGNILRGLGLGAGITHSDSYFYDDINSLSIPAYTLFKASLFYNVNAFRITLTADNLSNEKYWDYIGTPQTPRDFILSLNLRL